jgi:hypothetical protein
VTQDEELWIPLVDDEPISALVAEIQQEHPEIAELVASPRRLLAFRTFAYIRVGILLGRLLVERDVQPADGPGSWAEQLLADPVVRAQVVAEIRAVAEEIASDPDYAGDQPVGPDDAERERFAAFAKRHLAPGG